jgi:hypothetical protein
LKTFVIWWEEWFLYTSFVGIMLFLILSSLCPPNWGWALVGLWILLNLQKQFLEWEICPLTFNFFSGLLWSAGLSLNIQNWIFYIKLKMYLSKAQQWIKNHLNEGDKFISSSRYLKEIVLHITTVKSLVKFHLNITFIFSWKFFISLFLYLFHTFFLRFLLFLIS